MSLVSAGSISLGSIFKMDPDPSLTVEDLQDMVLRCKERLPLQYLIFYFFIYFFIFLGIIFFSYYIQSCICRPSDSTVPTDAGIEPRTVAAGALAVRRSNH